MHAGRLFAATRLADKLSPGNLEEIRTLVPAWVEEGALDHRQQRQAPRLFRRRERNQGRPPIQQPIDFNRWQVAGPPALYIPFTVHLIKVYQ